MAGLTVETTTPGRKSRQTRRSAPPAAEAAGATASELLEQETAFLMRALEAAQRHHKYPLERAHYLALRVIESQGPQTVASIAHHLLLDDSTVTRQVIEMEQEGLVAKRPNPADGRSAFVDITARGRSEAMRMRRQRTERIDSLVCDWSARQRRDFAVLLSRFNAALAQRARENPPSSGKSAEGAAPK
jgi:DNA-binding MarR family transcriptional regulator